MIALSKIIKARNVMLSDVQSVAYTSQVSVAAPVSPTVMMQQPTMQQYAQSVPMQPSIPQTRPAEPVATGVQEQAQAIIDRSHKEAEHIITAAMKRIERERSEAKQKGYDEGFNAGADKAIELSNSVLQEMTSMIDQVSAAREALLEQFRQDLRELVVDIAAKVIDVKMESDDKVLMNLVRNATQGYVNQEWVKILVSETDSERLVRADSEMLRAIAGNAQHVEIIPLPEADKGTVIIEMPQGSVDASVRTQLKKVDDALKSVV